MLSLQEAVDHAKQYLAESFPDFSARDLRLEVVETPLRGGVWALTFSAAISREPNPNSLLEIMSPRRMQKLVEVEKDSGILIAVKNKAA
jgi:hypothetical protein